MVILFIFFALYVTLLILDFQHFGYWACFFLVFHFLQNIYWRLRCWCGILNAGLLVSDATLLGYTFIEICKKDLFVYD